MAFDINANGGYGDGSAGSLTVGAAQVINSYASITAISKKTITLGNISGDGFVVGADILVHCSAYSGSAAVFANRGKWFCATITAIDGATLTLNKSLGSISVADSFWQAVSIPKYKNVAIKAKKSLTAPRFDKSKGYGGIVAFKCSGTLTFSGGHIDLTGKGLDDTTLYDKGLVNNELNDAVLRISAGWENHRALQHLTLNYPDGACFIMAKKIVCNDDSRIGNPANAGVARSISCFTGSERRDSRGGSSILICAETIDNFNHAMIAKQAAGESSTARGWGRCYIATETLLPCDEGLYAYDRISDPTRLSRVFNIKSFGDGSDGASKNLTKQMNNYAEVSALDKTRKVFTIAGATTNGLAKFKTDALVMIHCTQKGNNLDNAGKFYVTKIVGYATNKITVADAAPDFVNVKSYSVQIISVPQFTTFTLAKENKATPKFENGRGGICALAVSDTCDLTGGHIYTPNGGAPAYGEAGLDYISNAQMAERLPIGEGLGSVFILANNLVMSDSTRLGGTHQGNAIGGISKVIGGANVNDPYQRFEGGDNDVNAFRGLRNDPSSSAYPKLGTTGGGKQGGVYGKKGKLAGGYGSSGGGTDYSIGGAQGAHILIVANKITGFNLSALSTGGLGGNAFPGAKKTEAVAGYSGGCGFGGGGGSAKEWHGGNGGYIGGGAGSYYNGTYQCTGGGSGAFAFVYCNEAVDANYSGVVID